MSLAHLPDQMTIISVAAQSLHATLFKKKSIAMPATVQIGNSKSSPQRRCTARSIFHRAFAYQIVVIVSFPI